MRYICLAGVLMCISYQYTSHGCVSLCCVARVHVMSALIRTVWDQKVIISFVFTYLGLMKHRLFGIDTTSYIKHFV